MRAAWLLGASLTLAALALVIHRWPEVRPPNGQPEARASLEAPPGDPRSPLGINLYTLSDFSGEWPFIDAFKTSRSWFSGTATTWDDGRPLELDEDGWVRRLLPGQLARTLVASGPVYPAGDYVLRYDGEGVIEYELGASLVHAAPGRHVVRIDPAAGAVALVIRAVSAKAPLRNLRLFMPGGACEGDPTQSCRADGECAQRCLPFEALGGEALFHPDLLKSLRPFSVIRFMDWMATNDSELRRWEERPRVEHARWTERGVPLEVMLALARQLDADPWFTLPHLADDDYLERFAREVKASLGPGRRVYVERSNEVWNLQFAQARHAATHGRLRLLSVNAVEAQWRYNALRSRELFEIFERVFGGTERLVRVVGGQGGNVWGSETALTFGALWEKADALAIAPYFGGGRGAPEARERVKGVTPPALVRGMRARGRPDIREHVRGQREVADRYGLELIAYEGGQHLVGVGPAVANEELNQLFDAANRDPAMKGLYLDYLSAWRESGGHLFVHYAHVIKFSLWGRWGAREHLGQPRSEAPKYDALLEFIESNPRWWDERAERPVRPRRDPER